MSEPRWMELVGAYVLDALEPEERQAFEERMANDRTLRSEVEAQRAVVAQLSQALPRVTPPPALKARVLSAARAAPPLRAATVSPIGEPRAPSKARAPDRPPAAAPRRLPWFAAAAALVAVGLGVVAQRLQDRSADLQARLAATDSTLQVVEGELAERDSLLATFLGPDVRTASLAATGQAPSARVFWNTATSTMLVAVFDLPPAPEGRTYQLWGIADGANPVSLGTFQTRPDGTAVLRRAVPAGADFALGAVSEEPAGGSPQPTATPILVGSWTAAQ